MKPWNGWGGLQMRVRSPIDVKEKAKRVAIEFLLDRAKQRKRK